MLVGDLNLHLGGEDNPDTQKFAELMDCFSLSQFVVGPTHRNGHTHSMLLSLATLTISSKTLLPLI